MVKLRELFVKPRGMFPKQGEERPISPKEITTVVEVIRSLAARVMRGEKKAPPLEMYEAIQALMPQPAVEVIVIDGAGRYALHRRSPNDKVFGPHKLHLLGGFLKPDRKGVSMADAGREMVEKEMGATGNIEYVAGPIATYQWTRTLEHPTGWPNSQVYVLKVDSLPERDDVVWFDNNQLPPDDEMIIGPSGKIHKDFLRVYQEQLKNPGPCVDLNEHPVRPEKS